jgi:hypothetical protein
MLLLLLAGVQAEDYPFSHTDGASFSNLEAFRTKNYELNSTIHFDRKVVESEVHYNFTVLEKTDFLVLDVAGLRIDWVRHIDPVTKKQTDLEFKVTYPPAYKALGGYLNISLGKNHSTILKHLGVAIKCSTTNEYPLVASINWL